MVLFKTGFEHFQLFVVLFSLSEEITMIFYHENNASVQSIWVFEGQ